MSEKLLKTILQLFSILAKVDTITHNERDIIEAYLRSRLNVETAVKYLELFDHLSQDEYLSGPSVQEIDGLSITADFDALQRIGYQINRELTLQQKIVLLIDLIELISADEFIADTEVAILHYIGDRIKIKDEIVNCIMRFGTYQGADRLQSDHTLIIAEDVSNISVGNSLSYEGVQGFIAFLNLKEIGLYFVKYGGDDIIYLNGAIQPKNKIIIFATGSIIRGERFTPIFYSDIVASFHHAKEISPIVFDADIEEYRFIKGELGLQHIHISEEAGNLVAIMGASGAGKSTLFNILNGNNQPTKGKVTINGIDIYQEKKKIEGIIGYVPQDDLLIEDLTVYENLYFAAKLCFKQYPENEIDALVRGTLTSLGLLEAKDLRVGSVLDKVISGGQRKRLNIALELLRAPQILFVDEPTSGLSSRDSENIIDLLKELAVKGKLVFVIIHQPSSDIFKVFDKLILLDLGGYQIYYGNPVEAVHYFKQAVNMVDRISGACPECGNVNPEQIFSIVETRLVDEYGKFTDARKVSPSTWNQIFRRKYQKVKSSFQHALPQTNLAIPGTWQQFKIFSTRDLLSKIRNKQYVLVSLLVAPILATILAFIVRYYPDDEATNEGYSFYENLNMPAYFLMSIVVALFIGLTVSAEEIIRDRRILKREEFLNLSKRSYLTSKVAILFALSAFQMLTFTLVGNLILSFKGMNLEYWAILFSITCFANVLGLNISSAFKSVVTIYIIIPILLIPQMVLSGMVVRFDDLNPVLAAKDKVPVIADLMASRWAFEAAMVHQYINNPYEKDLYALDQEKGNADFMRLYFVPRLESKLDYCFRNLENQDRKESRRVDRGFVMLKKAISDQLEIIGKDKFQSLDKLKRNSFDTTTFAYTHTFLDQLKRYYGTIYNEADDAREAIVKEMVEASGSVDVFRDLRDDYKNRSIDEIVENRTSAIRILENNNKLIRKVTPIFQKPEGNSLLQLRTHFFSPQKNFLGMPVSTLIFNLGVIWAMTIILYVILYFDLLRKGVNKLSANTDTKRKN